jgi:hypothetical protein
MSAGGSGSAAQEDKLSSPRQRIQHFGLDRVNQPRGFTDGGYKIKPPPSREPSMIQMKDILGNGIAAAKAVEQPTVQVL